MTATKKANKNVAYEENVRNAAEVIYNWFYREDIEGDWNDQLERLDHFKKHEMMPKAEKLYSCLGSVEEIKKHLTFLRMLNPRLAKELVDSL